MPPPTTPPAAARPEVIPAPEVAATAQPCSSTSSRAYAAPDSTTALAVLTVFPSMPVVFSNNIFYNFFTGLTGKIFPIHKSIYPFNTCPLSLIN